MPEIAFVDANLLFVPRNRSIVDGITIGCTNNVRAAPGLEAALSAISHGAVERRRLVRAAGCQSCQGTIVDTMTTRGNSDNHNVSDDPTRSLIGIVSLRPDDLLGLDLERETDAAQGCLQSVTKAEWKGCGDHISFASRAHEEWKQLRHFTSYDFGEAAAADEHVSSIMITIFFVVITAYILHKYNADVPSQYPYKFMVWLASLKRSS